MLDLTKRNEIEESVLGTMIEYPGVAFEIAGKLMPDHFSTSPRHDLMQFILDEKSAGRKIDFPKGMSDDILKEAKQVFGKGHMFNFKSYVSLLVEEGNITSIFKMAQKLQDMATNDSSSVSMVNYAERVFLRLMDITIDEHETTVKDTIAQMEQGIIDFKKYFIDLKQWDKYIPIVPRSFLLLAANEGAGKTRFISFIMRKLLRRYTDEVAVLWYSLEDPVDKLLRLFIAQDEFILDDELLDVKHAHLVPKDVLDFNIKYITRSSNIRDIAREFTRFKELNKDKFCILLIDNVMKVPPVDKKADPDMEIIREIESWNVKTSLTKQSVILLHHFTKAVRDMKNKPNAYRPNINDVRGSGRYKDACTHVLLLNSIHQHKDIVSAMPGYEELLKRLFILDIAKNRNKELSTIRYFAYHDYTRFFEIDNK